MVKRLSVTWILVSAALLFGSGRIAWADKVVMKNGDCFTGTLVKAENGILVLKTEYSEKLEVRMDSIQSLATDRPVKVRLEDGEVLSGALATENGEVKVLAEKERGPTTVVWSRVVSINVNPPPPWTWSGNIFFGGNEQSGNTDRTSASFGADVIRKSPKDRYELSFLYNYAEENGTLTTRDAHGLIKYDYFFTRKFYGYLAVKMVKDRFRDLNLRTIVGPGIGYQIWYDKIKSLAFEGGISYFSEDRISAEDKSWAAARLGAKFRYKLLKRLTF